jgi:hypothetical protein
MGFDNARFGSGDGGGPGLIGLRGRDDEFRTTGTSLGNNDFPIAGGAIELPSTAARVRCDVLPAHRTRKLKLAHWLRCI